MKNCFILIMSLVTVLCMASACGIQDHQPALLSVEQESESFAGIGIDQNQETREHDYIDIIGKWVKLNTDENAAETASFLSIDSATTITGATGNWDVDENDNTLYYIDSTSERPLDARLINRKEDGAFLEFDGKTYQYHASNDTLVNTKDDSDYYVRNWQDTDIELESKQDSPVKNSLIGTWSAGADYSTDETEPLKIPQTEIESVSFFKDGTFSAGERSGLYVVKGDVIRIYVDEESYTCGIMKPDGMFSDDSGGDIADTLLNQDYIMLWMDETEENLLDDNNFRIGTVYIKN